MWFATPKDVSWIFVSRLLVDFSPMYSSSSSFYLVSFLRLSKSVSSKFNIVVTGKSNQRATLLVILVVRDHVDHMLRRRLERMSPGLAIFEDGVSVVVELDTSY
jgi:hypothetical protein